ncbi:hypothetical protein ABW19_dt0208885 [Dactylella cylindrospora]|nr:hypothetical protein ABW19_dt0208885 [Dactylella cylindrospora]
MKGFWGADFSVVWTVQLWCNVGVLQMPRGAITARWIGWPTKKHSDRLGFCFCVLLLFLKPFGFVSSAFWWQREGVLPSGRDSRSCSSFPTNDRKGASPHDEMVGKSFAPSLQLC